MEITELNKGQIRQSSARSCLLADSQEPSNLTLCTWCNLSRRDLLWGIDNKYGGRDRGTKEEVKVIRRLIITGSYSGLQGWKSKMRRGDNGSQQLLSARDFKEELIYTSRNAGVSKVATAREAIKRQKETASWVLARGSSWQNPIRSQRSNKCRKCGWWAPWSGA